MATPNMKDTEIKEIMDDRYLAQVFVTDEVKKGLKIVPRLGYDETEAMSVPWFTRKKTSKQMFDENLIMEPMPTASGGQVLKISGSEMTPDNKVVVTLSYAYEVILSQMEQNPKPFIIDMQDMCYGLIKAMETSAGAQLKNAATESSAEVTGGTWDQSSRIAECIRSFSAEYRLRDILGSLDTLLYHATNYDELGKYIVATEGINNLQEENEVIRYGSMDHIYAAEGISEGETLGWFSGLPPADFIYRKIKGAYEPIEQKEGTEEYLPLINMKFIDGPGKGLDDVREYRFGASWTIPINRIPSIFYRKGI